MAAMLGSINFFVLSLWIDVEFGIRTYPVIGGCYVACGASVVGYEVKFASREH